MRILFDGTTMRPRRTGVGCYSEHLLRHLAAHAPDEVIVASNGPIETTIPLPPCVRVVTAPRPVPRLAWMQLVVPRLVRDLAVDVAHFTNGMIPVGGRCATVVTIHDTSLTTLPHFHPPRRVLLHRPLVAWAASHADAIITVSNSACRDIASLYRIGPDRLRAILEAAAPWFRPVTDERARARVRERYGLAERFALFVGAIEPRKNLPRLMEAFAARRHAGDLPLQLVCAGPYGWLSRGLTRQIERLGIGHALRFTGYVPAEDLPVLYSLSELFVFPSLYEGFGLPVVEAMACGTPVIASRAASLTEVADGAVEFVDPLDTVGLGEAMVRLARDPERRRTLAARGLARAETFSWDRAAQATLAVYRQAVAAAARRQRATPPAVARDEAPRPALVTAASRVRTPDSAPVLLGQAYFLRFDPKLWRARQPYPPLGTLYAAAYLRERGHRVVVFDAMLAETEADWAAALDAHRPRVAVLYEDSFNYLSKMCLLRMREAALRMIGLARARGVTIVVAGSDATDHPAIYLDAGAAAVVLGEGELALADLVDRLTGVSRGTPFEVPGLAYQDATGRVRRSAPRAPIRDLDLLPRPAWDLVDVDAYRAIWTARHGYHSMNLVTTRGCPYQCNWCARPIFGQRYAARSPERVVDEIAWLQDRFRPDHLWIADDIFGLKPGWIERFSDLVVERGVVTPFKCLLRADQVTAPRAAALRRAGCETAWIGAESGSQRILDAMQKGTTLEQIASASALLKAAGITVGFFLQFGYPGETREDVERTLAMVRSCGPDDIGVSVSYPLPGTPFYEMVKSQLGDKQNWLDSDDLAPMYRATFVPAFYRTLHRLVHGELRARRAWGIVRTAATRPWAVTGRSVRDVAHGALRAAELPLLRRRLERLARQSVGAPGGFAPVPTLGGDVAAVPGEWSR
jgi:radical SAM superfamily enzyme YgiQ (UPF0313 family)/glycosyltransferase involved in cell wall biosynthesis